MHRRADRYFEENKPHAGLGRASLRSGALLMSARLVNVIVQVGSTILLARLLDPYQYGLATLVLALTAFAPFLIDLGTTDASINRPRITRREISSLYWLNVAIGAALTVLFAAASGLIASFFGERSLVGIALWSSLTFVLTGLSVQHYSLMRRAMEFDRISAIDIAANLAGSVIAIGMALTGWSYWALVAKPLLTLVFTTAGAWYFCPWIPGRPRLDGEVKQMLRFGLGVTGFTLTDQLTRSADRLAVGYFYGPGPLGYFQNAYLLYGNAINILAESLHNVAVSGLSKLKEDAAALKRAWASALSLLSFVSTAAFAVLAVTSQDLVVLLLGEKWAPAGPILCILGVRGIAHCVERTLGWLHVVAGRSDRWMKWGAFSAACLLASMAIALPFGPVGVAAAYAVTTFALFVPTLVYAGRPLGIGARDVLSASGPQVAAGVIAAVAGLGLQQAFLADASHLVRFLISIPICLSIYLAVAVGVFRVTEPLRHAAALLKDLAARRGARRD